MASVFTKILNGELPAYKIHEDELTFSILTIEPIHLGHALVIPKMEVDHWFNVDSKIYAAVGAHAQKIAPAIQQATGCKRILTAAIGFEVHHYHLHLIPAWDMTDLAFSKAHKRQQSEMESIHKKIVGLL